MTPAEVVPMRRELDAEEARCDDRSDVYLAERLADRIRGKLLHVWPWNAWLRWDGARWARDPGEHVIAAAVASADDLYGELAETFLVNPTAKDARRKERFAEYARSRRGLDNAVYLARAGRGIPIEPDRLDADPMILNTATGVLDLTTGDLHPHDPSLLCTKVTAAGFRAGAKCPTWDTFLWRVTNGDPELIEFLQRAAGYSLTGLTREQCFLLLYGSGANGKSTFLETLRYVLGDYAEDTPFATFLARDHEGVPNDLARLRGARFVTATEADAGRHLAEAVVKKFTGGDVVTARFMRAEFFEFRPEAKLWLGANHKPVITGTDNAIWRRVRLVPFEVVIPPEDQDRELPAKLRTEADGILAWAYAGCARYLVDGLPMPGRVRAAVEDYRFESDVFGEFLADRCDVSPVLECAAGPLYEAYRTWALAAGWKKPMTATAFGRALTERGFTADRASTADRTRVRRGLALRGRP